MQLLHFEILCAVIIMRLVINFQLQGACELPLVMRTADSHSTVHHTHARYAFLRPGFSHRLAWALLLLSVAAVLFSLALFRLISFFIMPSLFFDLLLVGFPLGAALLSPHRAGAVARFRFALPCLQLVMVATVMVTLALKHVDYMRGNLLFHVDPVRLLIQILVFSLLYLPFFMAYGANEYLGYLAGVETFERRMRGVYALFLFGAGAAFLLVEALLPIAGITGLLALALALVTLSRVLVAERLHWRWGVELLLLVGVIVWPGADRWFMSAFKSSKQASLAERRTLGTSRVLYSGWGRYAYFEVLQLRGPFGLLNVGFYNDVSQWVYPVASAASESFRNVALGPFVQGAEHVAVIGAGGGRDVRLARDAGVPHIVAIELEPLVPRAVQGPLRVQFQGVYNLPGVEVVIGEARRFFEQSGHQFDLIFFWSVGGYAQLMLEPGNMVRTKEALQTFIDHLSERGLFVLGYDAELDPQKILLQQYFSTLNSLGCHVIGLERGAQPNEYLLLAGSPRATAEIRAEQVGIRDQLPARVRRIPPRELTLKNFSPVTDDRPYLGGNIRNILPPEHILFLALVLSVGLIVVGAGIVAALRLYERNNRWPRPSIGMWLAFLVGANFVAAEHLAVLEIFRHRYVYYDALVLAAVLFLTVTGLGSLLLSPRRLKLSGFVALLLAGIWLAGGDAVPLPLTAVFLISMTFVAGSFFPLLFDRFPRARMHIFAMDAVGAAAGALLAFFAPILAGFAAFRQLALALYLLTALAIVVHTWRIAPTERQVLPETERLL